MNFYFVDFGTSVIKDDNFERSIPSNGEFTPNEQIILKNKRFFQSDIFSLGKVLKQVLVRNKNNFQVSEETFKILESMTDRRIFDEISKNKENDLKKIEKIIEFDFEKRDSLHQLITKFENIARKNNFVFTDLSPPRLCLQIETIRQSIEREKLVFLQKTLKTKQNKKKIISDLKEQIKEKDLSLKEMVLSLKENPKLTEMQLERIQKENEYLKSENQETKKENERLQKQIEDLMNKISNPN